MPDYRLYFLGEDGHIRDAVELDCADDAVAIALAEDHRQEREHTYAMVLWQRDRRVRAFPAQDGPNRSRRRTMPPPAASPGSQTSSR
jgi:hypothetical protein